MKVMNESPCGRARRVEPSCHPPTPRPGQAPEFPPYLAESLLGPHLEALAPPPFHPQATFGCLASFLTLQWNVPNSAMSTRGQARAKSYCFQNSHPYRYLRCVLFMKTLTSPDDDVHAEVFEVEMH